MENQETRCKLAPKKKAMALHGKKLVLPNGKTIQWQHDPNAKNKLKAVKLD